MVDQIDGAPAIRISGQHWGGIITKSAYRDYKLVAEFRWGLLTWGQRKDRARDSGILLHCQGTPGKLPEGFQRALDAFHRISDDRRRSRDIILVGGYADNGELLRPVLKAKTRKDRDGETVFDANGQPNTYSTSRINWWGRSEDWVDKLGVPGPADVEHPGGEWNHLEAIVENGNLTYYVNGRLVNQGFEGSLSEGRLLFQSEGAEVYFRRIELQPLP